MRKLLCPSMMCANYDNLRDEVIQLDNAGIDIFHCDVMDGDFVSNLSMGLQDIQCVRRNTNKMVDCHLMIDQPGNKIQWFIDSGVDLIYIHPESERFVLKTLAEIKSNKIKSGLAINPDTSIETIEELLNLADYVMVMTVNPGFAGQEYIEFVTHKIKKLINLKKLYHYQLVIDGACSPTRIKELSDIGCDGFILGTSALFGKNKHYKKIISELRKEL